MYTDYQRIRNAVEQALLTGKRNFIIYPYGEYGVITKQILNDSFGIKEEFIMDNKLSQFNRNIKNLSFCKELDSNRYTVLFTCANPDVYEEVLQNLKQYFTEDRIVQIFEKNLDVCDKRMTQCGKYSYGPLCNHWLVESVGAFCGFAPGSDVVENHAVEYISTHPFLYYGSDFDTIHEGLIQEGIDTPLRIEGCRPRGDAHKLKRIKIGNDVWLGHNVTITNGADIGNGVIAGAGAVITKDVPDYAVVMGIPARIVRYRYTQEEIAALNRIAWWDWNDEKIKENFDDFYLDIKSFISKYDLLEK